MEFSPEDFEQLSEYHHHAPSVAAAIANMKQKPQYQQIRKVFELTETEFETLKAGQAGVCDVCGSEVYGLQGPEVCGVCTHGRVLTVQELYYSGKIKLVL